MASLLAFTELSGYTGRLARWGGLVPVLARFFVPQGGCLAGEIAIGHDRRELSTAPI